MPHRGTQRLKVPQPPKTIDGLSQWATDLGRELDIYFRQMQESSIDKAMLGSVDTVNLTASFTISPNAYVLELRTTGNVTSDATTSIKDGHENQVLILQNMDNFNVVIKHGANTRLNAAVDHTLIQYSAIAFRWDGSDWLELFRSRHPGVTA